MTDQEKLVPVIHKLAQDLDALGLTPYENVTCLMALLGAIATACPDRQTADAFVAMLARLNRIAIDHYMVLAELEIAKEENRVV